MNLKKTNQEKLILTLLAYDILHVINHAMRLRGIKLTLDFTKAIPILEVYSSLSDEREPWMFANPRSRRGILRTLRDPTLKSFQADVEDRLTKMGARLVFGAEKPFNKKPICKLQVHVRGVKEIVLTLADVESGKSITEMDFQTPDGETP